ncbi:MAG: hypothetical protein COA79_16535 [Planctomycetota bacterium]|nr:MAG: hypothetical protein COA79_16535 [Planctomycetota bacterium]
MTNQVIRTIEARHSKRSFLKKDVSVETVKKIIESASNAPSGKNSQPWKVAVLTGQTRNELSEEILKKFDENIYEKPDYQYNPQPIPPEYRERARQCGFSLFKLKGIDKDNKPQRKEHDRQNYLFFDAPLLMIFYINNVAEKGNFLDTGFFMQNIMLGLLSEGISSCPQFSVASYPDTIRKVLNIADDQAIVSALACGYADDSKINTFIPPRLPVDDYTTFYQ